MHSSTDNAAADEATTYLLSRLSSEGTLLSTPETFSDYNDDLETYYHKTQTRSRKFRIKHFLRALTHTPLGINAHRKPKSRRLRLFSCLFNFAVIWFIFSALVSIADAIFRPSYSNPPEHYKQLEAKVQSSNLPGRGNPRGEKIFIASNIIQHEMIRGHWGASLMKLIDYLGPTNVFVSIYENDSGPETILALSWLRDQLKCNYSISFGDHLPLSNFPTVVLPSGEARVKRLTYLTEVRNRLLVPLDESPKPKNNLKAQRKLNQSQLVNHTDTRFDRLLFINDIYFKPEDALNLLFSTNLNPETGIAEYQTACSMDFIRGGTLYDSLVIRDLDGYEISWFLYPWFTMMGSATTRNDVLAQKDAVRVRSCWSGMAAYEATPFLRKKVVDANPNPPHLVVPSKLSLNSSATAASSDKVGHVALEQVYPPLRFRHQSDVFWEASECCLINADLLARYPGIDTQMFINPFIRVAYDHGTWVWQPWIQRFERGFKLLEWLCDKLKFGWEENPRRNQVVGRPASVRKWVFDNPYLNGERIRNATMDAMHGLKFPLEPAQARGSWRTVEEVAEPGGFCGQKRLFVMLEDFEKANRGNTGKNWVKISVPP